MLKLYNFIISRISKQIDKWYLRQCGCVVVNLPFFSLLSYNMSKPLYVQMLIKKIETKNKYKIKWFEMEIESSKEYRKRKTDRKVDVNTRDRESENRYM